MLVSGLPPIRAAKLRYYEDRVFAERVLPAPALTDGPYPDRPAPRADDWKNIVRAPDQRLVQAVEAIAAATDGGLEQQRVPGLPERQTVDAPEPSAANGVGVDEQDSDPAIDAKPIEQARSAANARSAFAVDEAGPRQGVLGLDF